MSDCQLFGRWQQIQETSLQREEDASWEYIPDQAVQQPETKDGGSSKGFATGNRDSCEAKFCVKKFGRDNFFCRRFVFFQLGGIFGMKSKSRSCQIFVWILYIWLWWWWNHTIFYKHLPMDRMDIKTRSSQKSKQWSHGTPIGIGTFFASWNCEFHPPKTKILKPKKIAGGFWVDVFSTSSFRGVSPSLFRNPTEATSVSSEFFVTRKLVGDLGEITWDPALKGA